MVLYKGKAKDLREHFAKLLEKYGNIKLIYLMERN